MRIDEVYPSKFLRAADLDGETVVYTIESVGLEKFVDQKTGAEKSQIALTFAETEKTLGLNKTNATLIGNVYGADTDDWVGEAVVLFPTMVQSPTGMVEAIRVNETLTKKKVQAKLKAAKAGKATAGKAAADAEAEVEAREPGADDDIPW